MSDEPAGTPPAAGGNLQFDRAERTGGTAPGASCTLCKQAIAGAYYEVNGKLACARCRGRIMAQWNQGSGGGRFARALGLGAIAAALGAGLYFGIEALTGYEFGLVAVVVGVMVGAAVRKGSNGRGGARYQLLAMFLTYTAIAATDGSMVVREVRKEFRARADSTRTATDTTATRAGALAPSIAADSAARTTRARRPGGLGFVVALAVLLGVAYAAPIAFGIASPLHLVIAAFALYEAWKLNKGVALRVTGPYQATPQPRPA